MPGGDRDEIPSICQYGGNNPLSPSSLNLDNDKLFIQEGVLWMEMNP